MHFSREAVADGFFRSGGDLDAVASGSQITSNLSLVFGVAKTTADKVYSDRVRLIVGDGDQCLGRVTIDKLDAKNLRSWERCLGGNSENGGLCFSLRSILHIQSRVSQLLSATMDSEGRSFRDIQQRIRCRQRLGKREERKRGSQSESS